jgi:hypothetical protein
LEDRTCIGELKRVAAARLETIQKSRRGGQNAPTSAPIHRLHKFTTAVKRKAGGLAQTSAL